jgi:hypothetical protein
MVSTAAKRALLGRSSSDGLLVLVAIDCASVTLRVCNNPVDVMSGGFNYQAFPFEIGLATDNDSSPSIEVRICNVDRRIMQTLQQETEPPEFTVSVALFTTPDTIERTFTQFKLRNVTADLMWITGQLGQDRISTEPWPQQRATKTRCPSLFRR